MELPKNNESERTYEELYANVVKVSRELIMDIINLHLPTFVELELPSLRDFVKNLREDINEGVNPDLIFEFRCKIAELGIEL
ncbi:hypothetical protein KJ632_05830 [Patescibacteria group bacterium]|nr:hypothetical protein [Patescibacteria group bacterium]